MKRFTLLFAWLSLALTIHAQTSPTITVQPQTTTINPGGTGSLSVSASGVAPLSYRWFKDGSALVDGGGVSGALTSTLTFAAAQSANSGVYAVVVSNSGGSVTSNEVTVTVAVIYAPTITSATTLTSPPAEPVSYTITASNAPTSFTATGLPVGLVVNGSTGVISGTTTVQGIFPITLSATNAIGTGTATLALTVEPSLPSYAGKLLVNATGTAAIAPNALSTPANIVVDAVGNVFVADLAAHIVAKITPTGGLSTVAGTVGQGGSADGNGAGASFLNPGGVAIDGMGNLYVADTGNHTIRKIATDGAVSTVAGSVGRAGASDGAGTTARFFSPRGVVADAAGTLYVADTTNHTVSKITSAGIVSTVAGSAGLVGSADGTGNAARFSSPNSLALDRAGAIYVADAGNNAIRKISAAGEVTTLATGLNQPSGVAVGLTGNIFVADTENDALKEITAVGTIRKLALRPSFLLPATPPQFAPYTNLSTTTFAPVVSKPRGLACDAEGNFYWFNQPYGPPVGIYKATPFFPIVVATPPQNQTVLAGTSAQFRVTATGQPLNYVWYGPLNHRHDRQPSMVYLSSTGSSLTVAAQVGPSNSGVGNIDTNAGTYGVIVYNAGSWAVVAAQLAITPAPPEIAAQTESFSVVEGQSAFLTVVVRSKIRLSNAAFEYVWSLNGSPIDGATGQSYSIPSAQGANAGTYTVHVTEISPVGGNTVTSRPITLTVNPVSAPQITVQPRSMTVAAGAAATLSITATGAPSPTYQWSFNGAAISGATSASYVIPSAQLANGGSYRVTVINSSGSITSDAAEVTVVTAPVVVTAPRTVTVYAGQEAILRVDASGGGLTYQWLRNGAAIPGATGATLTLANAQTANAGDYAVVVTNLAGSVTTVAVALDIITTRLVNLSARGKIGGNGILSVGFVSSGVAPKRLLVRGIGPTLASFGVSGALSTPQLSLFDGQRAVLGSNTGWGGTTALREAFAQVGAFPLAAVSADAALLAELPGGLYTAQLQGFNGASGVGLGEIYDADNGAPAARLVNLSALGSVGAGRDVLIAGFVIRGDRPAKILVRAVGSTLEAFSVAGALSKPFLTLVDDTGKILASGGPWGGGAALSAAFTQVGAFALPSDSTDAALLVTLPPGGYTALVSGVDDATGLALVEVYEVPK